jgi:hypothetical protein
VLLVEVLTLLAVLGLYALLVIARFLPPPVEDEAAKPDLLVLGAADLLSRKLNKQQVRALARILSAMSKHAPAAAFSLRLSDPIELRPYGLSSQQVEAICREINGAENIIVEIPEEWIEVAGIRIRRC